MALVSCRECKREISDEAIACPQCGVAVTKAPASPPPKASRKFFSLSCSGLSAAFVALLAICGIWLAYKMLGNAAMHGDGLATALHVSDTKLYSMNVKATDSWATFDVAVNPGDVVAIRSATGSWRIKKSCPLVGWQGHAPNTCRTLLFDGRIIKEANQGALLWRAEGMDGVFVADVGGALGRVSNAGRLQFQINDDSVGDNDGALQLDLAVTKQ